MGSFRGVMFDFDGVIADSLSVHIKAWVLACSDLGVVIDASWVEAIKTQPSKKIAQILGQKTRLDARRLFRKKSSLLGSLRPLVPLLPGVQQVFSKLQEQGIPYGVVTNAPRDFVLGILSSNGLETPVLLAREDVKNPKPHPEPYLEGAKKLGFGFLAHKNLVVFEDSSHGLKAALKAGMYPVALSTLHPEEALISMGAAKVYRDLAHADDDGFFNLIKGATS